MLKRLAVIGAVLAITSCVGVSSAQANSPYYKPVPKGVCAKASTHLPSLPCVSSFTPVKKGRVR